jgi:hypothetical protein
MASAAERNNEERFEMSEGRLTAVPRGPLEEASKLAERTLAQMQRLSATAPETRDVGSGAPTFENATRSQIEDGLAWAQRVLLVDIGGQCIAWLGDPNIEVGFDDEAKQVVIEPPLETIRSHRNEADARRQDFRAIVPIRELDEVRLAALSMIDALVQLLDYQLDGLGRLTPRTFVDGSYLSIANAFQARYQSTIDACVPPAQATHDSMSRCSKAVAGILRKRGMA